MQINSAKTVGPLALALIYVATLSGCDSKDEFASKVSQSRGTLVDQINQPGKGLSFFTVDTLNPTWNQQAEIVRIPKLQLKDQAGNPQDESLFAGKVSFVGFFFATCRGVCSVLVNRMKSIEKEIIKDLQVPNTLGPAVQFVALTVDPENDTPSVLSGYAKKMELQTEESRWTLLTGPIQVIHSLAKDTFVSQAFRRQTPYPGERNFVHSEHIYVIDPQGRLRAVLNGTRTDTPADAREIATELLAKPALASR